MDKKELIRILSEDIQNPILTAPGCSFRDPAMYYKNDTFYIYFSYIRGIYEDEQKWYVGFIKTRDFRLFSEVKLISPVGYGSPGNIIYKDGKYIICYQSYFKINQKMCPGDECRLFLAYSDDLENWTEPQIISDEGCTSKWAKARRQIDPYLYEEDSKYYLFFKAGNFISCWVSNDLKTWEDYAPDKPIIRNGYNDGSHGVENPCVLKVNDKIYMFFMPCGTLEQDYFPYIATDDLKTWEEHGGISVVGENWAFRRYNASFILDLTKELGLYILLYHGDGCGIKDSYYSNIGIAFSEDFKNWHFCSQRVKIR